MRARGHGLLGSGGGGIGDGVSADCAADALLGGLVRLASRARQLVRLRASAAASTTSCLAWVSAKRQGEQLSECFAWHDRLAQGCQSLFAFAGLPWHADPIRRVARRTLQDKIGLTLLHVYRYLPMAPQRHIMALQVLRFPGSRAAYHRDV